MKAENGEEDTIAVRLSQPSRNDGNSEKKTESQSWARVKILFGCRVGDSRNNYRYIGCLAAIRVQEPEASERERGDVKPKAIIANQNVSSSDSASNPINFNHTLDSQPNDDRQMKTGNEKLRTATVTLLCLKSHRSLVPLSQFSIQLRSSVYCKQLEPAKQGNKSIV